MQIKQCDYVQINQCDYEQINKCDYVQNTVTKNVMQPKISRAVMIMVNLLLSYNYNYLGYHF